MATYSEMRAKMAAALTPFSCSLATCAHLSTAAMQNTGGHDKDLQCGNGMDGAKSPRFRADISPRCIHVIASSASMQNTSGHDKDLQCGSGMEGAKSPRFRADLSPRCIHVITASKLPREEIASTASGDDVGSLSDDSSSSYHSVSMETAAKPIMSMSHHFPCRSSSVDLDKETAHRSCMEKAKSPRYRTGTSPRCTSFRILHLQFPREEIASTASEEAVCLVSSSDSNCCSYDVSMEDVTYPIMSTSASFQRAWMTPKSLMAVGPVHGDSICEPAVPAAVVALSDARWERKRQRHIRRRNRRNLSSLQHSY